ncbi:MAG: cyclase family protein [Pseudomonadota bacterium]
MKVFDLSHEFRNGMPVYPGDSPPSIIDQATLEKDHYNQKLLTFGSHTGTHLDAPAHLIPGGATLDRMPVEAFIGPGRILDVAGLFNREIGPESIAPFLQGLEPGGFILFRTGWDAFWGTDRYFEGFPVLSLDAARLVASFSPKGVGLDAISADPAGSRELPVHRLLLGRGIIIVENLANLAAPPAAGFLFSALPLKISRGDGSPVRATAVLP